LIHKKWENFCPSYFSFLSKFIFLWNKAAGANINAVYKLNNESDDKSIYRKTNLSFYKILTKKIKNPEIKIFWPKNDFPLKTVFYQILCVKFQKTSIKCSNSSKSPHIFRKKLYKKRSNRNIFSIFSSQTNYKNFFEMKIARMVGLGQFICLIFLRGWKLFWGILDTVANNQSNE
jgi:hypothetical protein